MEKNKGIVKRNKIPVAKRKVLCEDGSSSDEEEWLYFLSRQLQKQLPQRGMGAMYRK
jgi:hypothetical protein